MYGKSSSIRLQKNIEDEFPNGKMDSAISRKISIDNGFCKHENFIKIWELYEKSTLIKNI